MAEKWVDRTLDDNRTASSTEGELDDQAGEAAFKAEADDPFPLTAASSVLAASSSESDDRKPAARRNLEHPHPFDDTLHVDLFEMPDLPEPPSKRARTSHSVASMPGHDESAGQNVARMPRYDHPGQNMVMSLESPAYQSHAVATPPALHHPNLHAANNPYANPSPGYQNYLASPHAGMPPTSHESPHRMPYPTHHYPQQHMMHPPYYNHVPQSRHEEASPEEPRRRTATSSGENSSQFRRGPSMEELESAKTARARAALSTWYQRLEDLYRYKVENGDCNVPQKYENLPELGIWVNKQRMEKKALDEGKRNSMSRQKIEALNALGFQWAKRKGQAAWNEKFEELVAYKRQHGDCQVPTKYPQNPALGRWVSTQEYEKGDTSKMTEERKNRLDDLGFKWTMMNN